ncbi:MAG TPA: RusA family crossover junction endodeoxyribonuclease [Gemmataceae bacterium]|jgi:Holliday junction resolvase RusA-like endonuclease|nr:RusA family crossover junction endodeoxyribonuclease [Gemmataceae bacterium]
MTSTIRSAEDWASVPDEVDDLFFELRVAPVSVQARGTAKAELTKAIRALTKPCAFVFTNDVIVEITWHISEEARYESDASADVDNIIKPLLDAVSGPEGVLVNDCQVQSVTSYWVGARANEQALSIRIRALLEGFKISKCHINFIKYAPALCIPIDTSIDRAALARFGQIVKTLLDTRSEVDRQTGSSEAGRSLMPAQRVFHHSRAKEFPIIDYDAFLRRYVDAATD